MSRVTTGMGPSGRCASGVSAAVLMIAAIVALIAHSAWPADVGTPAADASGATRNADGLAVSPVAGTDSVTDPARVPIAQPVPSAGPIPAVALDAYHRAATASGASGLSWSLLAGIGKVESDHGRVGGASLDAGGTARPPISGPGTASGPAKGPLQVLDGVWARWGQDGNGDGQVDVQNVYDAALGVAGCLNAVGGDLATPAGEQRAVLAYDHLDSYVTDVLAFAAVYAAGLPETAAVIVPITAPAPAAIPATVAGVAPSGSASGPAGLTGATVPTAAARAASPGSVAAVSAAPPAAAAPTAAGAKPGSAVPPVGGGAAPAPTSVLPPPPRVSTSAGGPVGGVTSAVPVPVTSSLPACVPVPPLVHC